jgi:hypothetical protein
MEESKSTETVAPTTPPAPEMDAGTHSLPPENPAPEYVTGIKLIVIFASVALSCFLMLLDTMVVSTAIPHITDTFHSLRDVGWYASAYQFGR